MEQNEFLNAKEKIIDIIDHLRPFLMNDGGNIEFVKYENNIVYIKMMGACSNCYMLDVTLKEGIEAAIKSEVSEVKEVINIG
ncbi:MAG: NifU family protein [Firmicutes bacterium]|nr:NifU family protein [Bacillota bacterium]